MNDQTKGATNYVLTARGDRTALGAPDTHVADDVCPRDVTPPGVVDSSPAKALVDKGCGAKKPDETFGGTIQLDVVRKAR
ncbi:MAG TPA: hypothetical protein VGR62_23220 [Candidatus Binatia bacterium]|jgi:hypothetical protein|nr:hypothetical protein [Candidatus Binatia bacterium]